jgi:hypothetical protein
MSVTVATLGERALRRIGVAVVPLADRPALTTTLTADTIATRALMALAVIAADETPSGNDQDLALSKTLAVHDSMVAQGFVPWTAITVPQAVAEEYVLLTALHLAAAFGKAGDPAQLPVLEGRVRKMSLLLGANDIATGAVMTVHINLAARGLVRWTVWDIPPAAEDPYVSLAATSIAPEFGQQPIKGDDAEAYRALAQIIALPSSGERVRAEYF